MLLMSGFVTGLIGGLIGLAIAVPVTYFVIKLLQKSKANKDNAKAKSLLEEAKLEAKNLKKELLSSLKKYTKMTPEKLRTQRYNKYRKMGCFLHE